MKRNIIHKESIFDNVHYASSDQLPTVILHSEYRETVSLIVYDEVTLDRNKLVSYLKGKGFEVAAQLKTFEYDYRQQKFSEECHPGNTTLLHENHPVAIFIPECDIEIPGYDEFYDSPAEDKPTHKSSTTPLIDSLAIHYTASFEDDEFLQQFKTPEFLESFIVRGEEQQDLGEVSVLVATQHGPTLQPIKLKPHQESDEDLVLTYGESFLDIHNRIVEKLNTNRTGLYMFYGEPGTGKTSYIKYLSKLVSHKQFIFIPTGMSYFLTDPQFTRLLISNNKKDPVIVLEDAEKAIESREFSTDSSIVASLLNLTDGIVGDLLNTSIICTYNTNRDKIDKALLRKGRLKYEYEFKALSVDDTNKLLKSLGHPGDVTEGMTIADIYNIADEAFDAQKEKEQGPIGFF